LKSVTAIVAERRVFQAKRCIIIIIIELTKQCMSTINRNAIRENLQNAIKALHNQANITGVTSCSIGVSFSAIRGGISFSVSFCSSHSENKNWSQQTRSSAMQQKIDSINHSIVTR
jgi:hypothetical protein